MDIQAAAEDLSRRSASQHSDNSNRSRKPNNAVRGSSRTASRNVRLRKTPSYASSSTSSVDDSLTSFPSFSPGSPKVLRAYEASIGVDGRALLPERKASNSAPSIVESLTQALGPQDTRSALFDDTPVKTSHIPGVIHLANDEFLGRIIKRQGAVPLVRQLAGDLAQRDAQITLLRRKAEDRERALRKIILECGISSLDLERRLRAIEEARGADDASIATDSGVGLENLIHDAMNNTHDLDDYGMFGDATIRAVDKKNAVDAAEPSKATTRGWKGFLWGSSSIKGSTASSVHEEASAGPTTMPPGLPNPPRKADKRSVLQDDLFQPPDSEVNPFATSSSKSMETTAESNQQQNTSLAARALRLVAGTSGKSTPVRDSEPSSLHKSSRDNGIRPCQSSTPQSSTSAVNQRSSSMVKSTPSSRRPTVATGAGSLRVASPSKNSKSPNQQNIPADVVSYGPVEMDTILPFDDQPPTVTQVYNRQYKSEFLTDRFGFIYDQRRKKRQREAAETIRTTKRGFPVEMITSSRETMSPQELGMVAGVDFDVGSDSTSLHETESGDNGKNNKKWQDYLKIATFPTELLSHTPSSNLAALEVLDDDGQKSPISPAISAGVTASGDGLLPSINTTTTQPTLSPTSSAPVSSKGSMPLAEEDIEPVKLLLKQLGEVHDALQREKEAKWNDFLRKVRAERKREGEAAAMDQKSHRVKLLEMPEVSIGDGEMIGVAGLGNKGKIGRAKWNEFRQLVLGGIPVAYRAKVWAECSGAAEMRVPGYYDDLVANRDGQDDPIIVSQIKMDINRTLTDNIFFRRGNGVAKLEEVLLAYSRRNKDVGYCQGMNMITACLLLIIPTAEDAFWLLASIIENILPQGYYDHSLLASRADQQVLRHYVSDILPTLSAHLDDLGIELEALTFQWFLSVFTDCLSAEALFRVWDVVFCINDGSTFLFQVALALLKLNEPQLLACSTPAGVYSYINHQMTNHAISIDGLIHASEGLRRVVKREDVEVRRGRAIEAEKAQVRDREANLAARKAGKLAVKDVVDTSPSQPATVTELELRPPIPVDDEMLSALG